MDTKHGLDVAQGGDLIIFVLVFLAASAIIVPLFQKYKLSAVLGFLMVGVFLGPIGASLLSSLAPSMAGINLAQSAMVAHVAEFGVVFLMFSIGLELTFERLKAMRKSILGLGVWQVVTASLCLGLLFVALGETVESAAILGMALALSSTAVVIPVLADRKALNSPSGRTIFATLLTQDIAVAPILVTSLILAGTAVGAASGAGGGLAGLLTLIPALIGMAILILLGRLLLRPLFNGVAQTRSRELFMAACLLVVMGAAQIAHVSGLSMGLGALIAGILLGETEFRREIEVMIEPFQGLLLGLFFVTVGARLDFADIVKDPVMVVGLALGLIIIKAVGLYMLALRMKLSHKQAFEVAALLAPAGEFAFVIIDQALGLGVVPPAIGQSVILSAVLSMMLIPFLSMISVKFAQKMAQIKDAPLSEAPEGEVLDAPTPVIIVGYGRVGTLVCELLSVHNIAFSVVDINPKVAARARALGVKAWFGDASSHEFLRRMGVMKAKALVVTASTAGFTDQVVMAVRELNPHILIVARARDAHHAERLYAMGASDAVPETIEASLQLAENTLIDLGVPMGLVLATIHDRRERFRKAFGVRNDTMPNKAIPVKGT